MIKICENHIKLDTLSTSLIITNNNGIAELLYYGKKLHDAESFDFLRQGSKGKRRGSISDRDVTPTVMSSNGEGNQKECLVTVTKNGIFTNRFMLFDFSLVDGFESCLPTSRAKGDTVCLIYKDLVSSVTLKQYFTTFADSDVIATHTEVINTSDGEVTVDKLMSLQLDFVSDRATVTSLDGHWLNERIRHDTVLHSGKYENSSMMGVSSGEHNPFIMTKINGGYTGYNLI